MIYDLANDPRAPKAGDIIEHDGKAYTIYDIQFMCPQQLSNTLLPAHPYHFILTKLHPTLNQVVWIMFVDRNDHVVFESS